MENKGKKLNIVDLMSKRERENNPPCTELCDLVFKEAYFWYNLAPQWKPNTEPDVPLRSLSICRFWEKKVSFGLSVRRQVSTRLHG